VTPCRLMKMETVCFSEVVTTCESTWCHSPGRYHHLHHCENLKPDTCSWR